MAKKRTGTTVARITNQEICDAANFLHDWSKGKPMRRLDPNASFYACGKWMTKISDEMRDALVAAKLAVLRGRELTITF